MARTRIIALLLLLCIIAILTGCGAGDSQVSNVDPTPTSFLDFLHAELPPGSFASHNLDNSTLSEEEYNLRRVINSLSMYHEITGQEYEVEVDGAKYGVSNFGRSDDWYNFIGIEDMATVFKNADFQQDFYDLYGYKLGIDAYYLPPQTLIEKYNAIEDPSNLVVWDNGYNLSMGMSGYKDHSSISCSMFYTSNEVNLQALMEFYARIDGTELNSAISCSGTKVYYTTTETGSVFFEDIGIQTTVPITAYIWKQDDAIIIMVLEGEFNEENLELCMFERHEL